MRNVWIMIPALEDVDPNYPWQVLPAGIHDASLAEISSRFATTPHRQALFAGFQQVVADLQACGCTEIYVDGSFTTSKPHPEDFDGCWEATGVDLSLVMSRHPALFDFRPGRARQKAAYLGEMFIASDDAAGGVKFLDFFQSTRGGIPKGILRVQL